ncbi:hypothetical protein [Nocardia sp. NBC_01377]|uniref:hypothetical protein n=1 Tax=Nocardia sp. NBC_01377 TaxID=2903595 RepID=UPI003867548F
MTSRCAGGGRPLFPEDWLPAEGDVHLRIWLDEMCADYTASVEAARHLIRDWWRRHWCTIELVRPTGGGRHPFPRLPYERLFLEP